MREDHHKVLTEDPRRGSRNKFSSIRRSKHNAFFDEDAVGCKESMMAARRRQKKINRKRFGDLLGPLRGWVLKQVGRRWDDVYSEVCELFDQRSVIGRHIHLHIFGDFVKTDVYWIDGKVCQRGYYGFQEITPGRWNSKFYVHPKTGILCRNHVEGAPGAAAAEKAAKEARNNIRNGYVVDADTHLIQEDGVWFLFGLKDIPKAKVEYRVPYYWSIVQRAKWDTMTLADREAYGQPYYVTPHYNPVRSGGTRSKYYATRKTAPRRILKAFGLVGTVEFNEPEETLSARVRAKYR